MFKKVITTVALVAASTSALALDISTAPTPQLQSFLTGVTALNDARPAGAPVWSRADWRTWNSDRASLLQQFDHGDFHTIRVQAQLETEIATRQSGGTMASLIADIETGSVTSVYVTHTSYGGARGVSEVPALAAVGDFAGLPAQNMNHFRFEGDNLVTLQNKINENNALAVEASYVLTGPNLHEFNSAVNAANAEMYVAREYLYGNFTRLTAQQAVVQTILNRYRFICDTGTVPTADGLSAELDASGNPIPISAYGVQNSCNRIQSASYNVVNVFGRAITSVLGYSQYGS